MSQQKAYRWALIAWLVLPALVLLAAGLRSRISTDLLDLAPVESAGAQAAKAMRGANQVIAAQVFVSFTGWEDEAQREALVSWVQAYARQQPAFSYAFIPGQEDFPSELLVVLQKQKMALLFPGWLERRRADYDGEPEAWPKALAKDAVTQLERFLDSPYAAQYESQISQDPLLLLPDAARQLGERTGQSGDPNPGDPLLIWLGLTENPFDSEAQERIAAAVEGLAEEAARQFPSLSIATAGVYEVARETSAAAKAEVTRLNTLTLVAVLLLLAVFLRRFRSVLRLALLLLAAVAWALLCGLLFFERIHVFALAMSAVLLGLVVDYGLHAELHRSENGGSVWRQIRKPLLAGCLSTCFGFLVILETPIPALRQVAVLVPAGLLGALGAVFFLYSALPVQKAASARLLGWRMPSLPPAVMIGVGVVLAALSLLALVTQFKIEDAITDFQLESGDAQARLTTMLGSARTASDGRQWVLYASDTTALMEGMQALSGEDDAIRFAFVEVLIPPEGDVLSQPDREVFSEQLKTQLDKAGFEPEAFAPFFNQLQTPISATRFDEAVAALSQVLPGPLGLSLGHHDGVYFAVFSAEAELVPTKGDAAWGVTPLAEAVRLAALVSKSSHTLMRQCSWAWLIVLAVICGFFGWKKGLLVGLLPLWACLGGAALQLLILGSFSLMSWLGLILAFCLALDYTAFAVQDSDKPLSSVRLSSFTTLAAFAILATSVIPALHVLGLSVVTALALALCAVEAVHARRRTA